MKKMVDLWSICKSVRQRAVKLEEISIDEEYINLAKLSTEAMKKVRDNPSIENAQEFAVKENEYLSHWKTKPKAVSYSDRVLVAIALNEYTVNKPLFNIPSLKNSDPEVGVIYVASSEHHPNEVKIGYTTIDINKRMRGISKKYGYPVKLEASARVQYPARLEKAVHENENLKPLRISGCIKGESNEWFYGEIQLYTDWIDMIAYQMGLIIFDKSWN